VPDAALITVLIFHRRKCPDCIADKTNLTVAAVFGYVERIAASVTVQTLPNERCRTCGNIGRAVSIGRD
jgi:glutaredoxin